MRISWSGLAVIAAAICHTAAAQQRDDNHCGELQAKDSDLNAMGLMGLLQDQCASALGRRPDEVHVTFGGTDVPDARFPEKACVSTSGFPVFSNRRVEHAAQVVDRLVVEKGDAPVTKTLTTKVTDTATVAVTNSISFSSSLNIEIPFADFHMNMSTDKTDQKTTERQVEVTSEEQVKLGKRKQDVTISMKATVTSDTADFSQKFCLTGHIWCFYHADLKGHKWWTIQPQNACAQVSGKAKAELYDNKARIEVKNADGTPYRTGKRTMRLR